MITPLSSVHAVGEVAATGGATAGVGGASAAPQADFGKVMGDVAGEAVDALRNAEATSIQGINGAASTQQVVEAVMTAEQSLRTAIAVRDKLVSAYQEISRMAI